MTKARAVKDNTPVRKVGATQVLGKLAACTSRIIVCYGGSGSSKCFARGTLVRMFSGELKAIEDIRPGDLVMGVDSAPRTVQEVHRGTGQLYRVHQTKAMDYVVSEGHLLCLQRSDGSRKPVWDPNFANCRWPRGRYGPDGDNPTITIEDYIAKSKRWKQNFFGYRVAVDWGEKPVNIDPYYLGLWLGDGHKETETITTADPEIEQYVRQYADKLGMHVTVQRKPNNKAASFRITNGNCVGRGRHKNPLHTLLLEYGLIKNKHIPDEYMFNSRKIRLQLLAGLIDTDGCLHSNGFNIIQKDPFLARQIYQLATSLGFRCSITARECSIKSIGFIGTYYAIAIYGDTQDIPTILPHKQASAATRRINTSISGIEVTPEGIGEYFGFSLNGDGLFLLEDCTVVHNSHSIAQYILKKFVEQPGCKIGISRKTFPALRRTAYDLMVTLLKDYGIYDKCQHDKTNHTITFNEAKLDFFSMDDSTKITSANFNYIWGEEAIEFDFEDYVAGMLTRLRAPAPEGCHNQIILSLNPTDANSWIKKLEGQEGVEFIHSTYKDNPYLDKEYIKSLESLITQDENYYRVYVLGEWGRLENLILTKYTQVDQLPQGCMWSYGLDFGYTRPTALVKVGQHEGKLYLEERIYKEKLTNSDLIELLSHEERADIYADSAEPQRIEEIRRAGYSVFPANKDVRFGIDLLKRQMLHITKSSANLLKEIRGYQYKKDKDGRVLEEPVKWNDHCLDAARYSAAGLVERYGSAVARGGSRGYEAFSTLSWGGTSNPLWSRK
jgi:PBSX family phage terminase large subunit